MKRFNELSVLLETSSGITPTAATLKRFIGIISKMGYNKIYLGMADSYKIKGLPRFGYKRGGYSVEDLREIDEYAKKCGVELVAQIQILGHLHYLSKYPEFADLFDTNDTLLVGDEKVYELIERMVKTISEGISSTEIHIGMDETFGLGTGNYLKKNAPTDSKKIFLDHLERVCAILDKYGYKSVKIWGDMLLDKGKSSMSYKEIAARLPESVSIIVWNYEVKDENQLRAMINDGREVSKNVGFAGAVWKYLSFGPNNAFSSDCILSQMKTCEKCSVDRYMVTLWADNIAPCSNFSALPSLYVAAEYAAGRIDSAGEIDKNRFSEIVGVDYDALYSLEYVDNPFKEKTTARSTSSIWVFFSDLLLGNFDTIVPEGVENAYLELAALYDEYSKNERYGYLFKTNSSLMRVLALRAHIPTEIREAYFKKDKVVATKIVGKIAKLKSALNEFLKEFCSYYLHDNFAFGVEVYQGKIAMQIARCDYAVEMLNAFIKSDEKIDELEGGVLPLGYNPMPDISHSLMVDLKMLISYCL